MNEKASEVGIIGQLYEDRRTGKRGVLESRDTKYKTLMLLDDDGVAFTISNSTFRSGWRKVKVDDEKVLDGSELVAEDSNKDTKNTSSKFVSPAIKSFLDYIGDRRKVIVLENEELHTVNIFVDDVLVAIIKCGDIISFDMMSDIYSEGDWHDSLNEHSIVITINRTLAYHAEMLPGYDLNSFLDKAKDAIIDLSVVTELDDEDVENAD